MLRILKTPLPVLGVILMLTVVCFWPALFNGFTNWDDTYHVTENPLITKLDMEHIKSIFTGVVRNGYVPLTILSLAVEYHFVGLKPFLYHLDNLILHLLIVVLLFGLALRMGLSLWASAVAALIFAIHPMHVESVAWVTERKDVLYAVFYLAAMHAHWSYLEKFQKRFFALTIIFGILSMLAKPMALSLPVILLILDGMKGRKWTWTAWIEKLLHFVYIVPIVWMTYRLATPQPATPLMETCLLWLWSSVFYIWKFFYPVTLLPLYSRPEPIVLSNPAYIKAIIFLVILIGTWLWFRRFRWLTFAMLFYLCSVFFLFQSSVSNYNVVADRYMYLPSVGLCFLMGYCVDQIMIRWSKIGRAVVIAVMIVVFAALGVKTYQQCHVWKDSVTLWTTTLKVSPNHWYALYGMAKALEDKGRFEESLDYYGRALKARSNFVWVYNNRGTMLLKMGREDETLKDLNRGIELDPENAEVLNNRSVVSAHRGEHREAIKDLDRAIALKPDYATAFRNRGLSYAALGDYPRALQDFDRALQIDPSMSDVYYSRALAYIQLNRPKDALDNAEQARKLGYQGLDQMIEALKE